MRENRRWHPRGQLLPWMSRPIETEDVITTTNITDKSRCIKEMNKGVLFFGEPTLRRTAGFCNGVICLYQVINLYSKSELSGNTKKKKKKKRTEMTFWYCLMNSYNWKVLGILTQHVSNAQYWEAFFIHFPSSRLRAGGLEAVPSVTGRKAGYTP